MKITENYEKHSKDELIAEADSRGLDSSGNKADIIAALELSDEKEPEQPPAPLPPLKASPIPQVDKAPVAETGSDPCPYITDDRFTDGVFIRHSDGEQYALCIHDSDGYGQTHTARNSVHQWQGKAEQFNAAFTKK